METTTHKFTVLGITDEVNTCDCCGKSGLKSTFAVKLNETDEIVHYGSTCVTRNTGIKNPMSAAAVYLKEQAKQAALKFRQSPEYHAQRARYALRTAMKIEIGKPSMEFVREADQAYNSKRFEIAAQFGVSAWELS